MHNSSSTSWIINLRADQLLSACFVACCSMLLAIMPLMFAPRTHYLSGLGPHSYWILAPISLFVATVFLRVPSPIAVPRWSRWMVLLVFLVPFVPLSVGTGLSMLIAVGVFGFILLPACKRMAFAFLILAFTWFVIILAVFLQTHVETRLLAFEPLTTLTSWMLQLFSIDAHVSGELLVVHYESNTQSFLMSPDKFGGTFLPSFILGLVLLGRSYGLSLVRLSLGAGFVIIYAAFRIVWLIGLMVESGTHAYWWEERIVFFSYVPILVLLIPILSKSGISKGNTTAMNEMESQLSGTASVAKPRWLMFTVFLCSIASVVLVCIGWNWVDAGITKNGKIMVDERYSRWEWSEDPIDTERFGVKTVYSYYNMVEGIGHYFDIDRNFDEITSEQLKDVSVLILKTPTKQYPDEVLKAIWEFVDSGGGLWLIGDHTNVFGMSGYLNQVGEPYGILNLYDAVIDPNVNRQVSEPPRWAHPIVRNQQLFLGMTGNTVIAPWWVNDVVVTPRLLRDNPDFSTNTGFGDFVPAPYERVGPTIQALALRSGEGRVALWSDSTVFSNFAIFLPGKFELVLGYIDWLNRKNSSISWRPFLLGAGFLLGSIVLLLFWFRKDLFPTIIICAWLGLAVSFLSIPLIYDWNYPPLDPVRQFDDVSFFEPNAATRHLPLLAPLDDASRLGYLTSLIAAQRVGKRPRIVHDLESLVSTPTAVIFQGTQRQWTSDDIHMFAEYIERGGKLIVLDAGGAQSNLLDALASLLPIDITPFEYEVPESLRELIPAMEKLGREKYFTNTNHFLPVGPKLITPNGIEVGPTRVSHTIIGGIPLLIIAQTGEAVAVRVEHGDGELIILATDNLFSDNSLGENSAVPDVRQNALLQELFKWYRD